MSNFLTILIYSLIYGERLMSVAWSLTFLQDILQYNKALNLQQSMCVSWVVLT